MTRSELALSMGVNIRTIGTWEEAGLPVRKPGARGRGHAAEYDLAACMAWVAASGRGSQMRNVTARDRTVTARDRTVTAPALPSVVDLLENACPAVVGALLTEGNTFDSAMRTLSLLLVGISHHLDETAQSYESQRVLDIMPFGPLHAEHPFRLAAENIAQQMRADD